MHLYTEQYTTTCYEFRGKVGKTAGLTLQPLMLLHIFGISDAMGSAIFISIGVLHGWRWQRFGWTGTRWPIGWKKSVDPFTFDADEGHLVVSTGEVQNESFRVRFIKRSAPAYGNCSSYRMPSARTKIWVWVSNAARRYPESYLTCGELAWRGGTCCVKRVA